MFILYRTCILYYNRIMLTFENCFFVAKIVIFSNFSNFFLVQSRDKFARIFQTLNCQLAFKKFSFSLLHHVLLVISGVNLLFIYGIKIFNCSYLSHGKCSLSMEQLGAALATESNYQNERVQLKYQSCPVGNSTIKR